MITDGQMGVVIPGKKKRKPTGAIPDAPRRRRKRPLPTGVTKAKPTGPIPDAPKKAIPTGAAKATPIASIPDAPRKSIPKGAKPVGTTAPKGAIPDAPRRRRPVNPNDPNLQKSKGGVQFQGSMTSEALKPNQGTSTMQAAANLASQFKQRLKK
jgi:hypothetical protein